MCFALSIHSSFSQELTKEDNDLLFSDIGQKQIVALGDATHTDYTASKFRVDLIKELVEKHNFSIIGIESNLFEVYKAFEDFKKTGNISEMNSSLYTVVKNNELDKLFFFLKEQNEKGNNIKVYGFDPNFSGDNTHETFTKAIQDNLTHVEMECNNISVEDFSKHFKKLMPTNLKALLRTKKDYKIVHDYLTCYLDNVSTTDENAYFNSYVFNIKTSLGKKIEGKKSKINKSHILRDSLMFENIDYLRNKYPNEKMILFGSSTHFKRNVKATNSKFAQSSGWINLGERLSKEFQNDYFFIAYTGVSGNTRGFYGKKQKLKKLIPYSIEKMVDEKYDANIEIMYLSKNRDKTILDEAVYSRFMGNTFYEIDLNSTVDGLFFIRNSNLE
ncbi:MULTISPECIES: erythromycin esterase family protein [unclassified Flavobacterium]|nr:MULTISPECIES: erythromycin esterase family protein [unclassified Flavobacterium]MBA5791787.1 erythromycin esterase family protein [Flavobacterium sp. xlx-221]